jgi:competence protein ComGF
LSLGKKIILIERLKDMRLLKAVNGQALQPAR